MHADADKDNVNAEDFNERQEYISLPRGTLWCLQAVRSSSAEPSLSPTSIGSPSNVLSGGRPRRSSALSAAGPCSL